MCRAQFYHILYTCRPLLHSIAVKHVDSGTCAMVLIIIMTSGQLSNNAVMELDHSNVVVIRFSQKPIQYEMANTVSKTELGSVIM